MYRIMETTKYWVSVSVILFIGSIVAFFLWGFNYGIDFTGGSALTLQFPAGQQPTVMEVNADIEALGIAGVRAQSVGESAVTVRMPHISNDQRQQILDRYADRQVVEESFTTVGPALGSELKEKSIVAIILVLAAIIVFVTFAFRGISHSAVPSWMFGVGAIIALIHDVTILTGAFIVLGRFIDVQIDAFFVTALLTILGFSVNDTIVVYDRIREGLKHRAHQSFKEIINASINTTLTRSINTSFTQFLVLLALYLFGGESIRYLVLALMLGMIVGTYSSIFIASPLLLVGQKLLKRA